MDEPRSPRRFDWADATLTPVSVEDEPADVRAARDHANLDLPLPDTTKFRMAKRALYRLNWPFLKHQVAFNQTVLTALSEYTRRQEELNRRFEELSRDLEQTVRRGLRQAEREIGDHVAALRSDLTRLQLQIEHLEQEGSHQSPDDADVRD